MKKWIIRIAICGLTGGSFGWFWHHEWVKPCKKLSERAGDEIKRAELDFKSEWERQARIRGIKSVLWGYENRTRIISQEYLWELKDELHRLMGDSKPVKVYQGKWHKDYLEIVKDNRLRDKLKLPEPIYSTKEDFLNSCLEDKKFREKWNESQFGKTKTLNAGKW